MAIHGSGTLDNNAGLLSGALFTLALAMLTGGCDVALEDEANPELGSVQAAMGITELSAQIEDLSVRTQELEDREAIRSAVACYGRGHDEIFRHLQGDQSPSLAILSECFTADVTSDVYFFNSPTPTTQLTTLAQLVGFIEQFAIDNSYTGARNIVGDVGIEFTGPDTARVLSATSTPHFIAPANAPQNEPTVDVVSARYIDEMVRGSDGVWRSRHKTLILDEFWRGTGFYPFAP